MCSAPGLRKLLILLLAFSLAGCQTLAREFKGPVRLSTKDVKIEKVLSPVSYEFDLVAIPRKTRQSLRLVCNKVQWVQGQRRVILGHGTEIIQYNGWRELLELPILGPLSLVFLPFSLIGWLFGSEGSKNQVYTSLYLLNPFQNAPIWSSQYTYKELPGKYRNYTVKKTKKGKKKVPLVWQDRKRMTFALELARMGPKAIPLTLLSNEKKEIVLPLEGFGKDLKEPVKLEIIGLVGKKQVVSQLEFIFDDTPPLSDKKKSAYHLKQAEVFYEVAGHYYRDKNYPKALLNFHKSIAHYRAIHFKPGDLTINHGFFRAYLFRGLSRLRRYSKNLSKLNRIPRLVAWRALIDLQTFLKLTPWHPQAPVVQKYIPLLAEKVYGKKKKKEKKQKEKKDKKGPKQ